MSAPKPGNLREDLRASWHAFVDATAPHRAALHAYCRRLTGNLWDAEDLVQDTLVRAHAQWGVTFPPIDNPKSYLLRTATNVWIDALRRSRVHDGVMAKLANEPPRTDVASSPDFSSHVRDAGARALALAPQERAALVLKEAFDMSIEEIASLLATTQGAVKSALHRARDHLREGGEGRRRPSPALLQAFMDRFNARDVAGLVALMMDTGTAENVGNSVHVGLDTRDGLPHFFGKVIAGHEEWPQSTHYDSARLECATVDEEPVLLMLVTRKGAEALMTAFRLEVDDDRVSRVRAYGFCPDTIRAIGERLNLRTFTGLYRAPDPI